MKLEFLVAGMLVLLALKMLLEVPLEPEPGEPALELLSSRRGAHHVDLRVGAQCLSGRSRGSVSGGPLASRPLVLDVADTLAPDLERIPGRRPTRSFDHRLVGRIRGDSSLWLTSAF